jgi:hypothetical protein
MPCRLPRWAKSTFPVPVILKRFLAPDLVLSLGIWLSFAGQSHGDKPPAARILLDLSVLIEHFTVATAALSAGRREGGYMAERPGKDN